MTTGEEHPRAGELTVDELARAVGMTVRNVRAYASRGLMEPPRLVGRTGYYGDEHVARLTLVRELLAEGYTLAAVERIVGSGLPVGANALAVLSSLRTPWQDEQPEDLDRSALRARAGSGRNDAALAEMINLGIVEILEDERVRILHPALLAAGVQVTRLGMPSRDVLRVYERLSGQVREVAEVFVDLFRQSVWRDFVAAGMPDEQVSEVQSVVERLHPVAVQALLAVFRSAMAEAIDEAIGDELAALPHHAAAPDDPPVERPSPPAASG